MARRKSVLTPLEIIPLEGDDVLTSALVNTIESYVAANSEGGRRAQACAAGLLDAVFGSDRVVVGVINDPDRRAPLDIAVRGKSGGFDLVFEVKDNPILEFHVRSSVEKTVKDHALRNLGFIAVSKHQRHANFDEASRWAARCGVKLSIFTDWATFYLACKCFAPASKEVFEGLAFRHILSRAFDLDVDRDGITTMRRNCATRC